MDIPLHSIGHFIAFCYVRLWKLSAPFFRASYWWMCVFFTIDFDNNRGFFQHIKHFQVYSHVTECQATFKQQS